LIADRTATGATAPLRTDAQRNRDRIIAAARRCFAENGLDVGVEEIARSAGVGMGTLYRRFPTKESLVHAIFEQRLDELQPVIVAACGADDPWEGLIDLLVAFVDQQAADHGFGQMVVLRFGPEAVPDDIRRRVLGPVEELIERAQRAGTVRSDLGPDDVPAIMRMAGATAIGSGRTSDWRRHVGLLLDGLRAR
jgi:AcrR family transcriptional regulator